MFKVVTRACQHVRCLLNFTLNGYQSLTFGNFHKWNYILFQQMSYQKGFWSNRTSTSLIVSYCTDSHWGLLGGQVIAFNYRIFQTIRHTSPPQIWEKNGDASYSPNAARLAHWGAVEEWGFFPYFLPVKPRYVLWSGVSYSLKNMVTPTPTLVEKGKMSR